MSTPSTPAARHTLVCHIAHLAPAILLKIARFPFDKVSAHHATDVYDAGVLGMCVRRYVIPCVHIHVR